MAVDPATARLIAAAAKAALKSKPARYFIAGIIILPLMLLTYIFSFVFGFAAVIQSAQTSVSDSVLEFIKDHEGFSSVPYRGIDSWNETIGYGHVIQPGETYTYLSVDEGELLLRQDLQKYEKSVQSEFDGVPLTQNQYDALVSLCYNLGAYIWGEISLDDDIKAGASKDVIEADFLCLDHADGREVEGLKRRRQAEFEIFEYGKYG